MPAVQGVHDELVRLLKQAGAGRIAGSVTATSRRCGAPEQEMNAHPKPVTRSTRETSH